MTTGSVEPALPGLSYWPDFLTGPEEERLLVNLASVSLETVELCGQQARRRVAHFGLRYGYNIRSVVPGPALPPWLAMLRARAASLVRRRASDFVEILVSLYPPGAGIGWHRDAPIFGEPIIGVSIGGAARLRFKRRDEPARQSELVLAPRSVYALSGEARSQWLHHLPGVKSERWSLTFRPLAPAKSAPRIPGALARFQVGDLVAHRKAPDLRFHVVEILEPLPVVSGQHLFVCEDVRDGARRNYHETDLHPAAYGRRKRHMPSGGT